MTGRRYTIVESVGSRIENVSKYEDLAKHHPSSGREPNREYETIHNQLEEVRHSNGRTLIKKDFVLLVNSSNRSIPVPSPLAGYAKTNRSYGTVKILDAPTNGKLLGQVLHLNPAFKVKDGDVITYGQHIGIQDGTGSAGTKSYPIHVHAELEEADFKRYITDIINGTLNPDDPAPNAAESPTPNAAKNGWVHPCTPKAGHVFDHLIGLGKAKGGFYPVGTNGLWHGGIHFDSGTKDAFEQSSVQCITAGEVIAYRVDENYPVTLYNEPGVVQTSAPFSTAFALVKHVLQPPAPAPAPAPAGQGQGQGQGQAASAQPPSIAIYSLYMHLKCWSDYKQDDKLALPAFWEASSYTVNTQRDPLTVRNAPQDRAAKLGKISKGTKVRASGSGAYLKLEEIISGNTEPALKASTEAGVLGYISSTLLKAERQPKALGSVVVLDPPVPIQAGELIGHLGTYQAPSGAAEPLLHMEVFSCDDVPGFISQSRAWAAQLPAKDKTLLKVHKGASLLVKHRPDISATNPPVSKLGEPKVGVDLLIPQALLDGLPATHKISVNTPASNDLPAKKTQWWHLENLLADESGNPISGWLAEEDLITTRHSPWEWEGFQLLEETGKPIDKLAYNFSARGLLSPQEQQNYQAQINKTDGGPTVAATRLYQIVDSNNDGVLTSAEIRTALGKPWQAQILSQLITKYESEWFWNASKWNELDPLLASEDGQKNFIWEKEKERIEKLSWWGDLAGKQGMSADGIAWHLHPIAVVDEKPNNKRCFCFEQGIFDSPCQKGFDDVSKDNFETLATQLGVEREVLRAIAVAETGDKVPFHEYVAGEKHATILYERHYMHRLLLKAGWSTERVNNLSNTEPTITHTYVKNYSYGSNSIQHTRLVRARELNEDAANMSCSWGKFQVMGEYYHHLYESTTELVAAQNYCAMQHLQYFKIFLTKEKRMLDEMKSKNWLSIARKYNGKSQVGYDTKIKNAYNSLKSSW
jgi:hypothetical protein